MRDEILDLETRIEELGAVIDNCRKLMLASRIAMAVGGIVLIITMSGVIRFAPVVFLAAMAAALGGIVFWGSNRRTAQDAAAELEAAEARRRELIGLIDLRVVSDRMPGRSLAGQS